MKMTTTKNKKRRLLVDQEIEAASQLIQLKNYHNNFITCDRHVDCQFHEPFTNIVQKSKEFVDTQDINYNNSICNANIRKRKSDGIASCSSSLTFDLDDNTRQDATQVVGSDSVKKTKKMKKFRSIVEIYDVTKPLS